MATTHIHHHSNAADQQRAYERGRLDEERNSYAAVWGILAVAVLAAIAYGFYASDRDVTAESTAPLVESTVITPVPVPVTDGTASTMTGSDLTPSTVAPGTPDTTTTESTVTPVDGSIQ